MPQPPPDFPVLKNAHLIGLKLKPDVSILFETNCVSLPHCADPVIHLVKIENGVVIDRYQIMFGITMHPAHIPGIDGQDDDVLKTHGGPEALAKLVSPRVEKKATLRLERNFSFINVTLDIEESHDFRTTEFVDRLSRFFDSSSATAHPSSTPTAPASRERAVGKRKNETTKEKEPARARRKKAS